MADEQTTPDAGDPGETMNMGSGDMAGADLEPKKEKKPGDWVTVEMPKVQKPAPASPPPASQPPVAPPPQPSDVERTVLEGAGSPPPMSAPKSQPTPGASSGYSPSQAGSVTTPPIQQPAPSGGMAWMEGIGIKDPNTQRIVLFGGGGVFLLCCLCSCVALAFTFLPALSVSP